MQELELRDRGGRGGGVQLPMSQGDLLGIAVLTAAPHAVGRCSVRASLIKNKRERKEPACCLMAASCVLCGEPGWPSSWQGHHACI